MLNNPDIEKDDGPKGWKPCPQCKPHVEKMVASVAKMSVAAEGMDKAFKAHMKASDDLDETYKDIDKQSKKMFRFNFLMIILWSLMVVRSVGEVANWW